MVFGDVAFKPLGDTCVFRSYPNDPTSIHQLPYPTQRRSISSYQDEACTGCFDEICARCLTESEDVIQGDGIHIDGLAVCEETPPGATARSSGTTLETLVLDKGYYRTSNSSHVVLECYQTHACLGGTAAESTCAVGFRGPCEMLNIIKS